MFEFWNTAAYYYLTPNSRACEIGISLFAKITDSAYNKQSENKKYLYAASAANESDLAKQALFPLLALIMD